MEFIPWKIQPLIGDDGKDGDDGEEEKDLRGEEEEGGAEGGEEEGDDEGDGGEEKEDLGGEEEQEGAGRGEEEGDEGEINDPVGVLEDLFLNPERDADLVFLCEDLEPLFREGKKVNGYTGNYGYLSRCIPFLASLRRCSMNQGMKKRLRDESDRFVVWVQRPIYGSNLHCLLKMITFPLYITNCWERLMEFFTEKELEEIDVRDLWMIADYFQTRNVFPFLIENLDRNFLAAYDFCLRYGGESNYSEELAQKCFNGLVRRTVRDNCLGVSVNTLFSFFKVFLGQQGNFCNKSGSRIKTVLLMCREFMVCNNLTDANALRTSDGEGVLDIITWERLNKLTVQEVASVAKMNPSPFHDDIFRKFAAELSGTNGTSGDSWSVDVDFRFQNDDCLPFETCRVTPKQDKLLLHGTNTVFRLMSLVRPGDMDPSVETVKCPRLGSVRFDPPLFRRHRQVCFEGEMMVACSDEVPDPRITVFALDEGKIQCKSVYEIKLCDLTKNVHFPTPNRWYPKKCEVGPKDTLFVFGYTYIEGNDFSMVDQFERRDDGKFQWKHRIKPIFKKNSIDKDFSVSKTCGSMAFVEKYQATSGDWQSGLCQRITIVWRDPDSNKLTKKIYETKSEANCEVTHWCKMVVMRRDSCFLLYRPRKQTLDSSGTRYIRVVHRDGSDETYIGKDMDNDVDLGKVVSIAVSEDEKTLCAMRIQEGKGNIVSSVLVLKKNVF